MYEQIQQLFDDMDSAHTMLSQVATLQRQMHADLTDENRSLQALLNGLRNDFQGTPADELVQAHHATAVHVRLALSHLHENSGRLDNWRNDLQSIQDEHRSAIASHMSQVPGEVWGFLDQHYAVPRLHQAAQEGPQAAPTHLLDIWMMHVPDTLPQAHDGGVLGTVEGAFGAVTGALGGLFTALEGWSMGFVQDTVGRVGDTLNSLYSSLHVKMQHNMAEANMTPCHNNSSGSKPPPYTPPPDPPPGTTTLSADEIKRRAGVLHQPYIDSDFPTVEQALSGMSPGDIQALEHYYGVTYHRDLVTDLHNNMQYSPAYFTFRVDQLINPDSITDQPNLIPSDPSQPHITMSAPSDEVAVGTTSQYQVDGLGKNDYYRLSYVAPDGTLQTLTDFANRPLKADFLQQGKYTIVAEINHRDGRPPQFVTLTQNVVDPNTFARDTLFALDQWQPVMSATNYKNSLQTSLNSAKDDKTREALKEALQDAKDYLPDGLTTVPFQAMFLPDGTSSPVPLRIFAKQLPDNTWVIVDLTIPGHPQEYPSPSISGGSGNPLGEHGEKTIDAAWHQDFLHGNPYGQGIFSALPPDQATSQVGMWQDKNQLNPLQYAINWLTSGVGLMVIGGVLALFPATDVIGGLLLFVGGSLLLAQSVQNVLTRTLHYGLPIVTSDPSTWIDPLVIATSIVGGGFAFRAMKLGGETVYALDATGATAEAGGSPVLNLIAKYHGPILVSAQNALIIQQILASNMSDGDKAQQIGQILALGGLIYTGGFLKNVPIYDDAQKATTDRLIGMLLDTQHFNDGLKITNADEFKQEMDDPALRQALLTYLGPQMGTRDHPPSGNIDWNSIDANTLRQQLIPLWNEYKDAYSTKTTTLNFKDWIFNDRTGFADPDRFSRFERLRYDATIKRALAANAAVDAANKNRDPYDPLTPYPYDPQLLQALVQGQGLSVDDAGNVTVDNSLGNDLRRRLINDGFSIEDLNQKWQDYKNGRRDGKLSSVTFAQYLRQVGVGADLGGEAAKVPLSTIKGLDPNDPKGIQRYILGFDYSQFSERLASDPDLAALKQDIEQFLDNPPNSAPWGKSLGPNSDLNALSRDFGYRFNDRVGRDLGLLLRQGKISGTQFELMMRLINPQIDVDASGNALDGIPSGTEGQGGVIGAVGESVDIGYSSGNGYLTGDTLRAQMLDALTDTQKLNIQKTRNLSDYQLQVLLNQARDSGKMSVPDFTQLLRDAYPDKVQNGTFDAFFKAAFTDKLLAEKVTIKVTLLDSIREQNALDRDNVLRQKNKQPPWQSTSDPGWATRWQQLEYARVRGYAGHSGDTDAQVQAYLANEFIQPDLIQGQPPTIRDDKAGYETGNVDPFQFECYEAIVELSQKAFDPTDDFYNSDAGRQLRSQLQAAGVDGPIEYLSYFFVTNGRTNAQTAAFNTWNRLLRIDEKAKNILKIYYVGSDGNVYRIDNNSSPTEIPGYPQDPKS